MSFRLLKLFVVGRSVHWQNVRKADADGSRPKFGRTGDGSMQVELELKSCSSRSISRVLLSIGEMRDGLSSSE